MNWSRDNLNKNLKLMRAYSFFRELDFTRGVFIVYLLGLGVNNYEIGILQTILFLAIVIFELPSGMMADKFKRKWVLALGSLSMTISFILFYLAQDNFWFLALSFSLIGISFALNSGSDSALLYDGLVEANSEEHHLFHMGKIRSVSTIALCLSVSVGGFLMERDSSYIFIVTSIGALISMCLILIIPESERIKSENITGSYTSFFKSIEGKHFFKFIILLALIEMIYTPLFVFMQSLFKEQGLSTFYISIVISVAFLIEAWAYRFTAKLESLSTIKVIITTLVIMSITLLGMFLTVNVIVSILCFFIYNTVPALLFAKTDDYIQVNALQEIRASLTSTQSLVSSIAVSFGYLAFGFSFDRFGAVNTLGQIILVIPFIGLGFIYLLKNVEEVKSVS